MDPTSFASILAGVKRMREQYDTDSQGGEESGDGNEVVVSEVVEGSSKDINLQSNSEEKTVEEVVKPSDGSPNSISSVSIQPKNGGESPREFHRESSKEPVAKGVTKEPPTRPESSRLDRGLDRARNDVQLYSQIQVAPSQKQNPLLQSPLMKQKPVVYNKEILSDYYINPTLQVLFLSLKYHQLHPEYVWRRIKKLKQGTSVNVVQTRRDNALRILLVVIDIESPQEPLRKLTNICVKQDLTLIIAWSFEQAGNYIAMLKENELSANQVNLSIKGIKNTDFKSNIIETLTTIKSINKTDSINLMANYKNFKSLVKAENHKIHGVGDRKLQNLKNTFSEPFIYGQGVDSSSVTDSDV